MRIHMLELPIWDLVMHPLGVQTPAGNTLGSVPISDLVMHSLEV